MDRVNLEIDDCGRIQLPDKVLTRLGIQPTDAVVLEVTDTGALIRSKANGGSLTERIASMNLPVSDWEAMKQEIESGRAIRSND
jgi:bifunctional DNA-binding transcriptional regulator/antitoxin component of YhaV-PrlF toxin-antitoxin module